MPQSLKHPPPSGLASRRRIHYIDRTVQKRLLVALVALETALVTGAVWLMHARVGHVIDQNVYRGHLANAGPLMHELLNEALPLLGAFAMVNLVALLVVDGVWYRHVNYMLRDLMVLIRKTGRLDFSMDPDIVPRHEVLALARCKRERERVRLVAIRAQAARLDAAVAAGNDAWCIQDTLDELQKLLR